MGGMEVFKAQDVQQVTFKPPPPPVQEVQAVQAQDITPIPTKTEDVVAVKPQGQTSEISVVTGGGPNQGVTPLPNAGLGDLLGDLLNIGKIITKEGTDVQAPSAPKTEAPKQNPTPASKPKDGLGDFLGGLLDIVQGIGDGGNEVEEPAQEEESKVEEPTDEPKEEPKVEEPTQEEPKVEKKEDPEPEEKPIPASGRTFKTQGDPIVKTGDGLQYSLNEPGKYVSLQSASGDFRMEQEVQETKGGRHYNTAMGFKVGNDTIAFDTDGGSGPATMTVNGKKVDLKYSAFSQDLPGGGTLSYDPKTNKVNITSPEGDKISVTRAWNDQKTHYLNASVELSEKRPAGSVSGVLGSLDADDDAKNDAKMRDGSVFKGAIGDLWSTPEDFLKEWRTRPGEGIL